MEAFTCRRIILSYREEVGLIKGLFVGLIVGIICAFSVGQIYAASYQMHTIVTDETYYNIAQEYGVDVNTLKSMNEQESQNLQVGDLIKIKQIDDIKVVVNGVNIPFDVQPYIENGHVFVPIRFVSEALASNSISWNEETKTATVKLGDKNIIVSVGSSIATVNGQAVKLDAPVQFYEGRTFVPVRFFSEVLGVDSINWDQNTHQVSIKKAGLIVNIKNITPSYSEEDLYWLSRLVEAEAGGESFEGKVAVADTVINRKNSPDFPKTIKDIIFDTNFGTQYTPVANGTIYNTPSIDSINAAKEALEGYDVVGDCMFFVNPTIAISTWIEDNRTYYTTIENHEFYL